MGRKQSVSRRNFLKGTAAVASAAAAGGGALGWINSASAASLLQGQQGAPRGSVGQAQSTFPANKISAALPPTTKEVTLHTPHTVREIAPGMPYELWSFDGRTPGPHIHVKEGDEVKFTLINDSGIMAHSIDFHAALLPWNKYYQSVAPGEKHSFNWTAKYPGVFMYHCGTPPVLLHLANGMHGAVIVEPKNGWPEKADREYVLVQNEYYLMSQPDDKGVFRADFAKMNIVQPDFVVFNGYANQYQEAPLEAKPNELIRIHVCNAGPSLFSAFHVIGTIFTAAYADGNPANKQVGMQTVMIPPGGGYTVEMRIPDEGLYPFVSHSFAYPARGGLGVIKVGNPEPIAASH